MTATFLESWFFSVFLTIGLMFAVTRFCSEKGTITSRLVDLGATYLVMTAFAVMISYSFGSLPRSFTQWLLALAGVGLITLIVYGIPPLVSSSVGNTPSKEDSTCH